MKHKHGRAWGWVVAFATMLAACGGGGGSSDDPGTMRVALTDAPACGYDAVHVTVDRIRVHQSGNAGENDAGWSDLVVEPPRRIDLLGLQNGLLEELGQTALPSGRYQQMRLVLARTDASAPEAPAHAVVPTGATEQPLQVPSAVQSGLKLDVDLQVPAGGTLDLVLDFDACKSVVRTGAGRYALKPVVSVLPRTTSGVSGAVAAGWPAGTTQVSLQQAGTVVKSTSPGAGGAFMLQPVLPGTYDLVIAAPGQATLVVTGVAVTGDAVTAVNAAASPFAPTASDTGIASGRVSTGATPVEATTRALQALAAGATIEVAGGPVNAETGDYSHALAVAAPRVAPYVAAPGTLTFTADTAAAGRYAVQATAAAGSKTVGPFSVAASAPVVNDITVP